MKEEIIRTWQLQTVYIIPLVLCTMRIIPYNLHRTLKMLSFHTAVYTLTQKAVILSTCQSQKISDGTVKITWPLRPELFWEPTEQLQFNSHLLNC